MADDLKNQWVGPMPVDKFMEDLLPLPMDILNKRPRFSKNHFSGMVDCEREIDMQDLFIRLVFSAQAMPGFKLVNTSFNSSSTFRFLDIKDAPNVCSYKNGADTDTAPTRYGGVELVLNLNLATAQVDPFTDPLKQWRRMLPQGYTFENKGPKHNICRRKLASYANVWTADQHRTHCFIVWIGGSDARFIRVDRSGGVVSERFQYETNTTLLDFLWRFSMTTDEARGFDQTVTRASVEESILAKHVLHQWRPEGDDRPVLKLKIPDPPRYDLSKNGKTGDVAPFDTMDDLDKTREVLVWGSLSDPRSVTGRATRRYPALDVSSGQIVFVKDSWRSCGQGLEKESDIIRVLNEKGVRNVPKLICGDDLLGRHQTTATQDFADEKWNAGARKTHLIKRVHTRFAEDLIGLPLSHQDAYEKCKILHRNISAASVMLSPEGGGILTDWDLAQYVDEDDKNEHRRASTRIGTWQFMSIELLTQPDKVHHVRDDIESFHWLLLYHALRYMNHDKVHSLEAIMRAVFDQCSQGIMANGEDRGGDGKKAVLLRGAHIGRSFIVPDNPPLTNFLHNVNLVSAKWLLYTNDRMSRVMEVMVLDEISFKEAFGRIPFAPPQEAIAHTHMASLFAEALAREDWPPSVAAFDYLAETQQVICI